MMLSKMQTSVLVVDFSLACALDEFAKPASSMPLGRRMSLYRPFRGSHCSGRNSFRMKVRLCDTLLIRQRTGGRASLVQGSTEWGMYTLTWSLSVCF